MIKACVFILLLLPRLVSGEWALGQSGDGHWISDKSSDKPYQLVVAEQGSDIQFLLILASSERKSSEPIAVTVRVDRDEWIQTQIIPLQQRSHGMAFRIDLSEDVKQNTIRRMIAGLNMQLGIGSAANKQILDFSLIGFTAAYTDLLIANEIGRLGTDWLIAQGKDRELACYQRSRLTVQVMQARRRGQSSTQLIETLARTGLASVDDQIDDIVSRVYRLPYAQLPRHAMAEKYNLYKRCMGEF